jgi:glucosyl-dolichyl phosphate glucuronosyltransferase
VRFSLIIVTMGRPAPLRAALSSAVRTLPSDGELIVVDGDPARSAARPVRELRARNPRVHARYLASEPGTTVQRNAGIAAATGDVVVFIDDDCTLRPGLFEALARAYRDASVVGVTGLIEEPTRPARLGQGRRLRWLLLGGGAQGTMNAFGFRRPIIDRAAARDVEYMYGPLMSARREHATAVRFDERLSAYALGEDDDFSYRLSRRGRLRYEPAAVVRHDELGRRHMNQRHIDRLQVVNKSYLFGKNFPATLRARSGFAALLWMLCAHRALNGEWAGLRGLIDGVAEVRRSRRRAARPAPAALDLGELERRDAHLARLKPRAPRPGPRRAVAKRARRATRKVT